MGVGALIVANRPGNAIGWVFAAIALLAVTGALAEEYAGYAVRTRPGLLPGGVLAGWYAGWAWYPTVALALVFTPLLFPDGRPPSPPWRLVAWLTGAVTALVAALAAVQPTIELDDGHVVDNPIGVAGLGDPEDSLLSVALGLLVLAAVASLVVRFRRSRGEERLQLKWFTYAGALLPLVLLGDFLPADGRQRAVRRGDLAPAGRRRDRDPALPAVRHRPADQPHPGLRAAHRPARRRSTPALVLVLGQLSGGLGTGPPSWAVAGATLAVAALFQPARRRIQAVVDRRFNRRRYDAAKTIEAFSARLRDQVDLDTLSAELLAVVDQTMQPTRASLRPPQGWRGPAAREALPWDPSRRPGRR